MNAKEILNNVKTNKYKILNQKHTKRKLWDIFGKIEKDDGTIIESYVYCRKCCKLFKTPHGEYSNLHRHKCYAAIKKGPQQAVLINKRKKAISTPKITTLESFCRTCMREHKPEEPTSTMTENAIKLISLSKEYKKKNSSVIKLMDILVESCPQLTIAIDDKLPKQICNSCLDLLLNLHKFQTKALQIEQKFSALIGACNDPLQDTDEPDLLSNNTFQEDEGGDVSTEPIINVHNPIKGYFTLVEKDGQIIEVYSAVEKCDQAATGSNEILIKIEDDINTATCDNDKQSDVSVRKFFKDDFSNINLAHAATTPKEREHESEELENNLIEQKPTRKSLRKITSNDMNKTYEPASKENDGSDSNGSNLDTENKFELSSHLSEGVKCDSLEQDFTVKENEKVYKKDNVVKSKVQGFTCDKCGEVLKTRHSLKLHSQNHIYRKARTENGYICPECGLLLKTLKTFKRHFILHEKDETKIKNKCKFCNKVFSNASNLRDHVRTHTGERPYLCSICGKSFATYTAMTNHYNHHGTEFNYHCSLCPKKFKNASGLSSHKALAHSTIRPHVCDVCGSSFKKPYALRRHKINHGERMHKCDYCELKFSQIDQCRRHMRRHTGEKPYNCKYCERAFAQSNDMMYHMRCHLGEYVYRCQLCPQAFRLLRDLRSHFPSHKDDDEQTKLKNMEALKEEEERIQIKIESEKANAKSS